jgi:hypothetical protein
VNAEAFSSEVGTGSREENASNKKRFQAKWVPVRVKKTRRTKKRFQAKG